MAENMRVHTLMIKNVDMVRFYGLMADNILGNGKMVNNMVKAYTSTPPAVNAKEFGKMEKDLIGLILQNNKKIIIKAMKKMNNDF